MTDHTPDETPIGPTAGHRHQWFTLEQGDVSISIQSGGLLAQWREVKCACGMTLTADYANWLEAQVATLTEEREDYRMAATAEATLRDEARHEAQEAQATASLTLGVAQLCLTGYIAVLGEAAEESALIPEVRKVLDNLPAAVRECIDRTARLEAFVAAERDLRSALDYWGAVQREDRDQWGTALDAVKAAQAAREAAYRAAVGSEA